MTNFLKNRIPFLYILLGLLFLTTVSSFAESATEVPEEAVEEVSEIILFVGHFHPLIVHLPIGFIFFWIILDVLIWKYKREDLGVARPLLILFSSLSAMAACIIGYFLSLGGGYETDMLDRHMWSGIGLAIFTSIAYILVVYFNHQKFFKTVYKGCVFLIFISIMLAGHYGGALTHGSDYLTINLPNPLRKAFGMRVKEELKPVKITKLSEAVVYRDLVQPIFNSRCTSCHNPSKKKGDLLLTSYEDLMKGGKHGASIIPGNIAKSELFHLINLPSEDKLAMPPKGKQPISKDQIALIGWWIENGASADKKVADLPSNENIKKILANLTSSGPADLIYSLKVEPASEKDIEEAKRNKLTVLPISKEQNLLQLSGINIGKNTLDENQIQSLEKIAIQIAWLDLRGIKLGEKDMQVLSKMKNLNMLHLENTMVGDAILKHLQNAKNLEYLNLYGTYVTDAGLKYLEGLKNLKVVYLWKTKVTQEGRNTLLKKLPQIKIVSGMDEATIQKDSSQVNTKL